MAREKGLLQQTLPFGNDLQSTFKIFIFCFYFKLASNNDLIAWTLSDPIRKNLFRTNVLFIKKHDFYETAAD